MKKKIDPKLYGLSPRTILYQRDPNKFIIEINRRSRIIMKDATAILDKADNIKNVAPDAAVTLETTAPICNKSVKFLSENGIRIVEKCVLAKK